MLRLMNDNCDDTSKRIDVLLCWTSEASTLPARTTTPRWVCEAWHWKDDALGDGRDYLLPRVRSLVDFNRYVLSMTGTIVQPVECAILSNCARMEIVLVVAENDIATDGDDEEEKRVVTRTDDGEDSLENDASASDDEWDVSWGGRSTVKARRKAALIVSECLASQLVASRKTTTRKGRVVADPRRALDDNNDNEEIALLTRTIHDGWVSCHSVRDVTERWCLVACGLAPPARDGNDPPTENPLPRPF